MKQLSDEHKLRLKELGLHYCRFYENVVRYNKPACGTCRHATYPKR